MIDQFYKFVLLFLGTLCVFHLTPVRLRWLVLLLASYWLYISLDPRFWWILPVVSAEIYLLALLFPGIQSRIGRRVVFIAGTLLALAPLFRFKYSDFILHGGAASIRPILLPLGISFYTFQAISYFYDVYRRRIPPYRHAGLVALHIAFFPHLLAGPLVKAENLIPQLEHPRNPNEDEIHRGFLLVFFGVFKKFAVANPLGVFVSAVAASPGQYRGFPFLLATALFRYQLYMDFSGYSDIAIGTARLLGIELPKNFDNPFAATSVADFWRRWHISLVSWFRDHVYFPMCRVIPKRSWFVVFRARDFDSGRILARGELGLVDIRGSERIDRNR